jgi:hypothetical protein
LAVAAAPPAAGTVMKNWAPGGTPAGTDTLYCWPLCTTLRSVPALLPTGARSTVLG